MKTLLLFLGLSGYCLSNLAQGSIKNIYFTVDSAHLNTENADLLEKVFHELTPGEKVTFRILIHDDAKNKGLINELNRKRAQEVQDFFTAEGIPATNLKLTKTPGREAKGFISDDMKNLFIYDIELFKAQPAVDYSCALDMDLGMSPVEVFSIPALTEKTITGSQGISVTIPAGTLEYKTGFIVKGEIVIELREAVKCGQIVASGLITMSDELPVQTSGMLWIKASCGGRELRIKKGKQISIHFPPIVAPGDSKLFIGTDAKGVINLHPAEPAVIPQSSAQGYTVASSRLHWVTCAGFDKADPKGSLAVKTSAVYPVAIRLLFKEDNQVLAAYPATDSKDLLFAHLPLGKKVILLVYGTSDGKTYFTSKEITTAIGGKEKVSLKEESAESLKNFLKAVDK